MPRVVPSQVFRFIASIPVIVLLTPLSLALAQQKPAPPSLPSQTQLEEHVKELETRLSAAEQKAASAAMEKDYITRVQKQYETYYEKAFNTQVWILSIMGLILTTLFFLAGRFGFGVFDRRIDLALREASAQLRTEFNQQLRTELDTLRKENAEQVKLLEDNLTHRTAQLESDLKQKIADQQRDLGIDSRHNIQFLQAHASFLSKSYNTARNGFRSALLIYKDSKALEVIDKADGSKTAANVFRCIEKINSAKFEEEASKELADHHELYDALKEELAAAALEFPKLAPLIQTGGKT